MKKLFDASLVVAMFVGGISLMCIFTYGCYWLAKTGSYSFFYEDMVIKTITQTVKPEYLQ